MHYFNYKNGSLCAEDVPLENIANEYGTPLYVYSAQTIRDSYKRLDESFSEIDHEISYAVKANSNIRIIKLLAELGSGFDIVSGGELYRVIKGGGNPEHCTFAGVGKTPEEISYALSENIYCFNVESEAELELINQIAISNNKIAPVALRVNPNVDPKTHKYISTGKAENKFGIDYADIKKLYQLIDDLPGVKVKGVQMHIGSQLTSIAPFVEAVDRMFSLVSELKEQHKIQFFSIGGGIGISYEEALNSGHPSWWQEDSKGSQFITPQKYAEVLMPKLKLLGLKIIMEPGRYLVGNAGVMLTRCLYIKKGKEKTFKIVDAAMNDLIRPALYEGFHEIVPLKENYPNSINTDVVGPVCESGDFFCQNRNLPDFQEGEFLALMSAGAYGYVMASNYNTRPLPTEVLVDGKQLSLIRKRQTYADLIEAEIL